MAVVVLVRHGRTTANATGVLAGWAPDVELDETGQAQADAVGGRLRGTTVHRVVSSPLPRCRDTAARLVAGLDQGEQADGGVPIEIEEDLGEARYGAWTGRPLAELAKEDLWPAVQDHPSSVTFPSSPVYAHESMRAMAARAVEAVRRLDREVSESAGGSGVLVVVSHGDVLKAVLADALGTPLDLFQRIVVDPASVSIVRYTGARPFVVRLNDTGTGPLDLSPLTAAAAGGSDAAVGGGAGGGALPGSGDQATPPASPAQESPD